MTEFENYPRIDGLKILVVDDNALNLFFMLKSFRKWGVQCDAAENGIIALTMIENERYDLVLMDIRMPFMNGFEVIHRVRNMEGEYFRNLPVFGQTGLQDEEIECIRSGMNGFFVSFDLKKLHELLSSYAKPGQQVG